MKLEEMPEYLAAHNEYVASVAVADRTSDEVAKLKAELSWVQRRNELAESLRESETKAVALKAAHEKIKAEYPFVPDSLLKTITDPETLLAVAKDMAEKIAPAGDWGGEPGAPSTTGGRSGKKIYGMPAKDFEALVDKANTNDPAAIKRYKTLVMEAKMLPFIERVNAQFGK